ncbi:uncharacterized protein [Venturia canescens]|uniref:uncharacterized protein n=1 Tax=Venturia canescens TaxID=32260 RepID=UPI001C9BD3B5|nr:uncharacterized protein LOC122419383 [Venturia canescens]
MLKGKMQSMWVSIFIAIVVMVLMTPFAKGLVYEDNSNGSENTYESSAEIDYRLPKKILPTSYEINLFLPEKTNFTNFDGSVIIQAFAVEPTDEVVLHVGKITILSYKIHTPSSPSVEAHGVEYDPGTEKYKILLNSTLLANENMTIAIKYRGNLRNDMIGLYRSSYIDKDGEIKWLATTQFQSIHARHAFPCFDEPSFKATFTLRVLISKNYSCLSNTRAVDWTEISDERVWWTFEKSVSMSTYLLAFIVSNFSRLQNEVGNFSVWARPEVIDEAKFALGVGQRALQQLESLFDINYQLYKMDMVAVPDFSAGAMENWGLITFRESRMLFNENISSVTSQQKVAAVIVHECVHMWFGNLVTPTWWGYLWLSEGFARYYEYMLTAKLEPSWKMEQQFVVNELQSVYGADALDSANPMSRNVLNVEQIGTSGDTITYAKAASVIRMMELSFGSDVFNRALQGYLNTKKYSSATPEDLWIAFQQQANEKNLNLGASIETIMNTWTKQAGFPVLSVTFTNGTVKLSQNRFFLRNVNSSGANEIWWLPITWTSGKKRNFISTIPKYWLGRKSGEIKLSNVADDWIVFNVKQAGYYRVNYDKDSWYRIINILSSERFEEIHEINRAAIVDDLLNLARANLLDYDTALTGLNYIKRETNYLPFKAAFSALEYLHERFAGQPNYHDIKAHSLSIIKNTYEKLGYEDRVGDDRLTILLRQKINNWACKFDHEMCIEKSRFYFSEWRTKSKMVPKNQKVAAYCSAIRYGSSEDWDFLWDQYFKSNCASEQAVILEALACSRNTTILENYLLKAVTPFHESRIRKQDSTTVFKAVYSSGILGAEYVMDFVKKHHSIMAEYDGGYGIVNTVLSGASRYYSTEDLIAKFEALINNESQKFETILSPLKAALELAKYELGWYEKNEGEIMRWMVKNNKADDTSNTTDYRLPTSIVPKSYVIKLTPYIEVGKFTFDGSVEITASIVEATSKIVLHVDEIALNSVLVTADGKNIGLKSKLLNAKYNFVTLNLVESLSVGQTVIIKIGYTGQLNGVMRGFYRSSYKDDSGVTRWLAATHLEPVGARKMFPCFDEPALKATFVLSVSRPANYSAISNTPKERVLETFEETPIMSTYLVALIVSDFDSLVDKNNNCSTWARPNAIKQAEYALSVMAPLVKFYENAVDQPYQLKKLDMVAVPDFASGAMENWGLITYRESNMLYDPNHSPITSKQSIANVISHEISHQWFGNQVSPRWWKYIWLSEGFARYFQYHGTANVETEWGLQSQFVVEQLQTAFAVDSRASTHPMTHDVYSPTEISSIFDSISYNKGASVIRMIEKSFGSEVFYAALHDYLIARRYNDATPDYLFEAFQKQLNSTVSNVKDLLEKWTTQAGYPVVTVTIGTGNMPQLHQKRFYLKDYEDPADGTLWSIPLTWATKSNPDFSNTKPKYWMSQSYDNPKLEIPDDEWIIFNVQESGYYRVNYESVLWERIIDALKKDKEIIHEVNRASLIDDLLILAQAGQIDYKTALSATQYLINETNYIPWRAAFNGLVYLNGQLKNRGDIYQLYKTHILTILNPIFQKLGFNETASDSHYDKLLRRYVVKWMCDFDEGSCVSTSLKYFNAWKSNSISIPADLRSTVYCTAMKHGSMDDWKFLWKKYLTTNLSAERVVILSALGCSTDSNALEKLLTQAITKDSEIRFHDTSSVFSSVYSSSSLGAEFTLNFIERNYMNLYNHYSDSSKIASILGGVSSNLRTKKGILKFEQFIKNNREFLRSIEPSLIDHLKAANEELEWYSEYSPGIFEWLDRTYPSSDFRLPTKIYPESYDIYLKPSLDENNFTFDGEVNINMIVVENTSSIVLLANELTINEIIAFVDAVDIPGVSSYTINATSHRFTIYLKSLVPAGSKLFLYISYTGMLNDKMVGFYRSSYVDKNGKTRWLASTQFEPVYARKAFPCFDEPAFKAKFTIHIERPTDYRTRSNMPWLISNPSTTANRMWDSYEQSVPMSSYLVAFVVSDFELLTNDAANFTIWARPEAVQYGAYALEVGQKVLSFMEQFTGIDYPIKKMDLVAIPDFQAGAMENWGLVTFREYGLLQHPNVTSALYKKYLHTTVAHELVHMWFGNLVTCDWWDYIWLHEGFAQYFQTISGDHAAPELKLLQQFVAYELHSAMQFDSSPSVHPMNNRVVEPVAIADSFDTIAYAKSASVLRMMHHALGAKLFQSGLRTYLEKNKYHNAVPSNLSSAFQFHVDRENSLGVSVESLMSSWTNNPGYPVVNATWTSGSLTLSQERFYLTRPEMTEDEITNNYWIPISMTTKSESNFTDTLPDFWFGEKRMNSSLALKSDEWFIINIQETGYYRVNYDVDSWNRLIAGLRSENFGGIDETNRAQIVDDLLNLARVDYVTYDLALGVTKYLEKEDNHLPWKAFFDAVAFLHRRFDAHEIGQDFADYVLGLVEPLYKETGFVDLPNENQLQQLNRELILSWACKLGHSGCIEQAQDLFNNWKQDETQWISPNARSAVYCEAIKHGLDDDWQFLFNEYKKSEFSSEKVIILRALGCSRNTSTLNSYLKLAISDDDTVRSQDVNTVLDSVSNADSFGVDAMLDFLTINYRDLWKYYGSWTNVASLFGSVAGKMSTEEQIQKLELFVNSSTPELIDIKSSLQSAVSVAKRNFEWYENHKTSIQVWLTKAPDTTESSVDDSTKQPGSGSIQTSSLSLILIVSYVVFTF